VLALTSPGLDSVRRYSVIFVSSSLRLSGSECLFQLLDGAVPVERSPVPEAAFRRLSRRVTRSGVLRPGAGVTDLQSSF
jgi:hypothetical protein